MMKAEMKSPTEIELTPETKLEATLTADTKAWIVTKVPPAPLENNVTKLQVESSNHGKTTESG